MPFDQQELLAIQFFWHLSKPYLQPHQKLLAFRRSCAHGVCGSDAMIVNGENMLACQVLVKEVSTPIKIEPIRGLPVIKDLVVNMDSFFDSYKKVMPFLVNDDEPGERERLLQSFFLDIIQNMNRSF